MKTWMLLFLMIAPAQQSLGDGLDFCQNLQQALTTVRDTKKPIEMFQDLENVAGDIYWGSTTHIALSDILVTALRSPKQPTVLVSQFADLKTLPAMSHGIHIIVLDYGRDTLSPRQVQLVLSAAQMARQRLSVIRVQAGPANDDELKLLTAGTNGKIINLKKQPRCEGF